MEMLMMGYHFNAEVNMMDHELRRIAQLCGASEDDKLEVPRRAFNRT